MKCDKKGVMTYLVTSPLYIQAPHMWIEREREKESEGKGERMDNKLDRRREYKKKLTVYEGKLQRHENKTRARIRMNKRQPLKNKKRLGKKKQVHKRAATYFIRKE